MTSGPSARLRPPTFGDLHAVYELIAARDIADLGEIDFQPEDLDGEWRHPEFSLERDARVAEAGAGLLGYARIRPEGAFAIAHPAHELDPLCEALLDWTEERERALGRACHRRWVASTNTHMTGLLHARGYDRARSAFRLWRPLADRPVPPAPPLGVELRRLDPVADGVAVHALDADAFAHADDYVPESFEAFRAEHLEAHDLDREASRIACLGGRMVGFLLARRWEREGAGYVDLLAVSPAAQGRGVGAALLGSAFADFAAAGLAEARLGVSSTNAPARRLYQRMGMRERHRFDIYERPV